MERFLVMFALMLNSGYMFTAASALPHEPTCSKFDYEMRSLEAMLRTEHKVEKMLEEMKTLKEAVSKDLHESKAFRESMKTDFGDLKSETDKLFIEKEKYIEKKLETITKRSNEKLLDMETTSQLLSNKVEEYFNGSTVAFSVKGPTKLLVYGVPTFSEIVTNIGGGYDTDTGVFTCPVKGLYLFLFTVSSDGVHDVFCYIRYNGVSKVLGRSYSDNSYTTASASVILELSLGDHVKLWGCGGWSHVYNSKYATTFSGTLIKPTSAN